MEVLPIDKVLHNRGLSNFDKVMTPDFARVSGLHGMFISGNDVMFYVLPSDNPSADWELFKSKHYSNADEMIEFFTLITAGFDLP